MLRKTILTLLTVLLCLRYGAAQTPAVGQKALPVALSTPDGHMVRLSELTARGPVALVVLRGFPGYQCPYCVKQVHDFVEHADQFAAAGLQVLLVYPGPPTELDQHAKEFLAKQNPLPKNLHLVIDPDYGFTNSYGLRWDAPHETAYPSTFLIGKDNVVLFRKISHGHGDRTSAADLLTELQEANVQH
jgi:peroxiredoxin